MSRLTGPQMHIEFPLQLGAEDLAENISGNLGWAYLNLGDGERALELFVDAQKSAAHFAATIAFGTRMDNDRRRRLPW